MTPPDYIGDGVKAFYGDWCARMIEGGADASTLPLWKDLDAEQVGTWTLAFAATVEVGARMGLAIVMILGGPGGH